MKLLKELILKSNKDFEKLFSELKVGDLLFEELLLEENHRKTNSTKFYEVWKVRNINLNDNPFLIVVKAKYLIKISPVEQVKEISLGLNRDLECIYIMDSIEEFMENNMLFYDDMIELIGKNNKVNMEDFKNLYNTLLKESREEMKKQNKE